MLKIKNYLYIFLFTISLFIYVLPLTGIEIRFYDCNNKEINPDSFETNWQIAADNVINNQEVIDCLPRNWKGWITTYLELFPVNIQICKDMVGSDCGKSQMLKKIMVPEVNSPGKCGCAESTILHELIHMAAGVPDDPEKDKTKPNDKRIRGCEALILTQIITNCEKNPPPGKSCDCQDLEGNLSPCRDPFQPPGFKKKQETNDR